MKYLDLKVFLTVRFMAPLVLLAALTAGLFLLRGAKEAPARPPFSLLSPEAEAPEVSTGAFKAGDTWNSALKKAAYQDILGVSAALKKAGVACPRPGDLYAAAYSTSGAAAAFALARGEDIYTARKNGGRFTAVKTPMPVSYAVTAASGTLESSLWEAMSAAGVSPAVIMEFADLFAWEIDFLTEPRKGDRFALVWQNCVSAAGRPCGVRVTAGAYSGEEAGEARGYYRDGYYYNGAGASLRRAFLRAPLSYRRISSYFSKSRYHPVLHRYRAHNGIDYAAPSGTPVSAIADGTVSFKGRKGGYGNFIELRHAGAFATGYGHLRGFARGLRQGQKVRQGDVIGYVGMTGLATGPHLDFSLKVNGKFTDFLRFRPPSVASLSGAELAGFKAETAPLAARLEGLLPAALKE